MSDSPPSQTNISPARDHPPAAAPQAAAHPPIPTPQTAPTTPSPTHDGSSTAGSSWPPAEELGQPPSPPHRGHALLAAFRFPHHLERQFWRSASGQQYLRDVDRRSFWMLHLNSAALVAATWQWPAEATPSKYWMLALILGICHWQASAACRPSYPRTRPFVVAALHCLHILIGVTFITTARACTATGPCVPYYLPKTLPPAPPAPAVARALLLFSSAVHPLIHALTLPLPPPLLAPLLAAYLAFIFTTTAVPATHHLSYPHLTPSVAALCRTLDTTARNLISLLAGGPFWPATPLCATPLAPWVLVLFTQVAVGLLLPLALSYAIERHARQRFLRRELGWGEGAAPWEAQLGAVLTGSVGWLVAAVVMLVVWEGVLAGQEALVHWALPLEWEGADTAWYDELVGRASSGVCAALAY